MIADAANRVVAVNRAFVEITGYGAGELIGRTPEVLRSSRQDEAFYRRIGEASVSPSTKSRFINHLCRTSPPIRKTPPFPQPSFLQPSFP